MHLKKNICESLVGTVMNTKGKGKDPENAKADLDVMGIHPELYIQEAENGKNHSYSRHHNVQKGE